jgi:antitoxin (DNA-binding transcriptional repressor) of toxin-antitoxin stability system
MDHQSRTMDKGLMTKDNTMPTVTIEEAQSRLSELIHSLLHGEELVITENDYPIAKLTRSSRTSWPCQPGSAKDKSYWMAEDFDAPLEDFKEYME